MHKRRGDEKLRGRVDFVELNALNGSKETSTMFSVPQFEWFRIRHMVPNYHLKLIQHLLSFAKAVEFNYGQSELTVASFP